MIITIDGPTASGKTTIARMLAQHLNYYYLSSGMLFRGLAYVLVHKYNYGQKTIAHVQSQDLQDALDPARLVYSYSKEQGEQLFFDGMNIGNHLRDKIITEYASILATQARVRDALTIMQHRIADHHSMVAEGRDTGSVIFPQAQVKFYLTASLDARAKRWYHDQCAKGRTLTLAQAHTEVQKRDERDMNRELAPLVIPEKAMIIDDTDLLKEQVLARMLEHINQSHSGHLMVQ